MADQTKYSPFQSIKKIDFDPKKQEDVPSPEPTPPEPAQLPEESRAAAIIDGYKRTATFMRFVEDLLRSRAQITVTIDPEDDPEVWLAMQRILSNPSPDINSDTYFQVLDALSESRRLEVEEVDPSRDFEKEFLDNLPKILDIHEEEIEEESFQVKGDYDPSKLEDSTSDDFGKPKFDKEKEEPQEEPPEELTFVRRWRKLVNINGRQKRFNRAIEPDDERRR